MQRRVTYTSEDSGDGPSTAPSIAGDQHEYPSHHRQRRHPEPRSRSYHGALAHHHHRGGAGVANEAFQVRERPPGGSVSKSGPQERRHDDARHHGLITKLAGWLHDERKRRATRKATVRMGLTRKGVHLHHRHHHLRDRDNNDEAAAGRLRGDSPENESDSSGGSVALDRLERILADTSGLTKDGLRDVVRPKTGRKPSERSTRRSARTPKVQYASSSDTDYFGHEVSVPECHIVLDNARTLGQFMVTPGAADENDEGGTEPGPDTKESRDFREDVLRLAHTLGIRGWRRVPLDSGGCIVVERLSGALTNAVYVVHPPSTLPSETPKDEPTAANATSRKPPSKLLLRIYGPQAEYLIDREHELRILKRLAKQSIGPRVLGTFANGRFEQYFEARTLAPEDIRDPSTSRQIAKRMRELHDGIAVLKDERDAGPAVWKNWDKWLGRAEEVVSWADRQVLGGKAMSGGKRSASGPWRSRGFICGVEWSLFRMAVEMARTWLIRHYGGLDQIQKSLVFAHNDTQYGNILQLQPSGESPLLLPANQHKRLVVIDFEYAAANTRGIEFANHFTEWCYDYRDAALPHVIRVGKYPSPEEQRRFIQSYVEHAPVETPRQPVSGAGSSVPQTPARSSSFVSTFMLDSRTPPGQLAEEEARRNKAVDDEVDRLMFETRLWRVANSAQWVAWGILQADIPEMRAEMDAAGGGGGGGDDDDSDSRPAEDEKTMSKGSTAEKAAPSDNLDKHENEDASDGDDEVEHDAGGIDGFDYLGYAHDRAMFFWGDVIRLGIVPKEILSADVLEKVKFVNH